MRSESTADALTMHAPSSITKITAVIHHHLLDAVLTALRQGGIMDLYTQAGRASVLRDNGAWSALLSGKRTLAHTPVEMLSCFVTPACELPTLRLIAQHGKLTRPGMGALYSETYCLQSAHPLCRVHTMTDSEAPEIAFYQDLVGIYCVVQRGQGDRIARVLLEMGAAVPTITYGRGMGIRDQLGLLRITIPADKEVLHLIVPAWDAKAVLDATITAGRLELPGRGFISTFPVCHGLLNTKMSAGRSRAAAASLEHIVAAIDTLTGNTVWRAAGEEFPGPARRFFTGRDLQVICNEGTGVALMQAAIRAGSAGATLEKLKLVSHPDVQDQHPSPAREICRLMVRAERLPGIVQAMEQAGALSDAVQAIVYHGEALKAFTYTASN